MGLEQQVTKGFALEIEKCKTLLKTEEEDSRSHQSALEVADDLVMFKFPKNLERISDPPSQEIPDKIAPDRSSSRPLALVWIDQKRRVERLGSLSLHNLVVQGYTFYPPLTG